MTGTGDFNGDCKADVLAVGNGGTLWLYPGNGSGGLQPRVEVPANWAMIELVP
jgi:hypothetical protein